MIILHHLALAVAGLFLCAFLYAGTEETLRSRAHRRREDEWRGQFARGLTAKPLHEWIADRPPEGPRQP